MDAAELHNALHVIARVLEAGEHNHPPDSARHWLRLNVRQHLAAACIHAEKALVDLTDEDHLAHFVTRGLLALEVREREGAKEAKQRQLASQNNDAGRAVRELIPQLILGAKETKQRQATSTGGATPQLKELIPEADLGQARDQGTRNDIVEQIPQSDELATPKDTLQPGNKAGNKLLVLPNGKDEKITLADLGITWKQSAASQNNDAGRAVKELIPELDLGHARDQAAAIVGVNPHNLCPTCQRSLNGALTHHCPGDSP